MMGNEIAIISLIRVKTKDANPLKKIGKFRFPDSFRKKTADSGFQIADSDSHFSPNINTFYRKIFEIHAISTVDL